MIPTYALILLALAAGMLIVEGVISKSLAMLGIALIAIALVIAIAGVGPTTHLALGAGAVLV